ncbi:MAG: DUF6285 domain-containing protein, partial [Pseudomonadales bacterium]|nr:DUF6285 domain-containing protein [Pseudomonadales bacterium]
MQDRPHDTEILQTVGDYLEGELLPELEGPLRYRTLVAVNLLRILQRELTQGTSFLLRERSRLCQLMDMSVDELLPGPIREQVEDLNQQLIMELQAPELDPDFERRSWEALMA